MSDSTTRITSEQLERVQTLSDSELYPEAVRFISQQGRLPGKSQIAGLLQFSQDWLDWAKFVRHQFERKTHEDADFYSALYKWNQDFPKRVKNWCIPSATGGADAKRMAEHFCSLLLAEFAQHLAAECRYQQLLRKERYG